MASIAARASGEVGSKPLGAALSGDDLISSTLTPSVFKRSVTLGYWNSTPIEPTSDVSSAMMGSAAIAVMYPPEAASPSTTTTSGFCSLSRINESCSCSEPEVVPPGLLMCTITARARGSAHRDHGADGDDDRAHAPEGELAPHAATIDDGIGIERHGSPPLDSSGLASLSLFLLLGRLFRCALERGAEDVAERRPRIGGAVLGDRLLLFRHFERLDRDLHLVSAAVELGDAGVDFLADREALRALLAAVAGQLGALDEGGEVAADDLHLEAGVLHLEHLAGHDRALLEIAGALHGIVCELLDAQRNALLLEVDVEHLGLDLIALLVLLDHLLARPLPVEVGEVDHAVDVAVEAEEEPELGLVLDLALEHGAGRILLDEDLPRIAHGLLEPERDAPLDRIDLEDLHVHLLGGGHDLAGMHVLLGPRHLGDVDEAFDAGLELHERAVVGDVGDAALEARA